jgi:UDP-2-acetamido-3-amino-2,3-dideoxy-glucuronate N-acetyltransferase
LSRQQSVGWRPEFPPDGERALGVGDCRLIDMAKFSDPAGDLIFGEFPSHLPFQPQRYFIIQAVPTAAQRGVHAHKKCHQLLICITGTVSALIDDGDTSKVIRLDNPSLGLYMPPLIWGTQFEYSPDARLLVLASHVYDPKDYITSREEFADQARSQGRPQRGAASTGTSE